jgi:hypothetical protein
MTVLKPFQEETVKAVIQAFKTKGSSRRFLVADEVGLGKTIVAQEVIRQLIRYRRKPLVVFYFCSNLSIANQNRTKLLEVLDGDTAGALCRVDRLTLVPSLSDKEKPSHPRLHLYTLTPETSLPLRQGKRRDGKKEERAIIHHLVKAIWPDFLKARNRGIHYFSFAVSNKERWETYLKQQQPKVARNKDFPRAFLNALKKEFNIPNKTALKRRLQNMDKHRLIGRLRNALAATALTVVKPDLIIFDEFQRFRDLVASNPDNPDESLSDREREVMEAKSRVLSQLRGDHSKDPPMLLLLSATPYRLYAQRSEEVNGLTHHTEFFDLIEFLYGGDDAAHQKRTVCAAAFDQLGSELHRGCPDSAQALQARIQVQTMLRPVIARTERASFQFQGVNGRPEPLPAPLQSDDLKIFRHLSDSFNEDHRASAVTYWTSIPLPMQTMGPHYVTWTKAETQPPDGAPHLTQKQRDQFLGANSWPHPRLRALQEKLASSEKLTLPWLPPSLAWWDLAGNWQSAGDDVSKLLIFSRFRAVPQAVSALLSFDLETELLAGQTLKYQDVTKRRALQARPKRQLLLAMFHPSPWLIEVTDPLAANSRSLDKIRAILRRQIIDALRELGVSISHKQQPKKRSLRQKLTGQNPYQRTTWQLLAQIENLSGCWSYGYSAWRQLAANLRDDNTEAGLARLLPAWNAAAMEPLRSVTQSEVNDLVEFALSAPGVVLGRALHRHWPEAVSQTGFADTLDVAWNGLRTYLDQRWFFVAIKGENDDRYPQAIRQAIIDGNLEAVLDEHLWIIHQIRSHSGGELAAALKRALSLRTSNFYMYEADNKDPDAAFSLRSHAVLPFTQAQTRARASQAKNADDSTEPTLRADELRTSFNSPFWPHVLVTTSVGQEGLDFLVLTDFVVKRR